MIAASEAALVIRQYDEMLHRVRAYDKTNSTISIGSAAAVQIPDLIGRLQAIYPFNNISTELNKTDELLCGLKKIFIS